MKPSIALLHVLEERVKQDAKWGEQNHTPLKWMMILQEELGEAAKAILEAEDEWDESKYREEMLQVAAVALAAVESYDRRQRTWTCALEQVFAAFEESNATAEIKLADAEIVKLKSENARLAAEADSIIEELSHHWSTHRNEFDRFNLVQQRITAFRSGERAVLRDLLAPTISFLEDVIHYEQYPKMGCFTATAKQELSRLRAAFGEKL